MDFLNTSEQKKRISYNAVIMRKIFHSLCFLCFTFVAFAQSPEEDEVNYQAAIDWLENKLNYLYYDDVGEQWWNNTFYANDEKQITLKHIASKTPNTGYIKSKTYTIRTFQIQDINPSSLKITDIKASKGRIVKGKMLELRTFDYQELIHKTINKRRASSTSFLFLSFPEVDEDSESTIAEIVREKLKEAIWASTQIYPSDYEHDIDRVVKVLTGSFLSESGNVWKAELMESHVLKLDRGMGKIEYFGYDTSDHHFYLLSIGSEGVKKQHFDLNNELQIHLASDDNPKAFTISNQNVFTYNGEKYFRQ